MAKACAINTKDGMETDFPAISHQSGECCIVKHQKPNYMVRRNIDVVDSDRRVRPEGDNTCCRGRHLKEEVEIGGLVRTAERGVKGHAIEKHFTTIGDDAGFPIHFAGKGEGTVVILVQQGELHETILKVKELNNGMDGLAVMRWDNDRKSAGNKVARGVDKQVGELQSSRTVIADFDMKQVIGAAVLKPTFIIDCDCDAVTGAIRLFYNSESG